MPLGAGPKPTPGLSRLDRTDSGPAKAGPLEGAVEGAHPIGSVRAV
jgi:hypothetical protein